MKQDCCPCTSSEVDADVMNILSWNLSLQFIFILLIFTSISIRSKSAGSSSVYKAEEALHIPINFSVRTCILD